LVNNAGAWIASPIDEPPGDDVAWDTGWDLNLALNLRAPADLCRLAIQHFRRTGGGIIINVASRSSHRGDDAEHLAYGAAKGGLLALTKGIARGFAQHNVLAYAVAPGWVATDLAASELDPQVRGRLPLHEFTLLRMDPQVRGRLPLHEFTLLRMWPNDRVPGLGTVPA
jgi:3-oxoacyl-[acyl-carrier protein] reductase